MLFTIKRSIHISTSLDYCQLQILQLLLYHTSHADHNVVTASLEALQQMLRHPHHGLLQILMTKGSVTRTYIFQADFDEAELRAYSKCICCVNWIRGITASSAQWLIIFYYLVLSQRSPLSFLCKGGWSVIIFFFFTFVAIFLLHLFIIFGE